MDDDRDYQPNGDRPGRVSPWKGTAFGVVQMVNTYDQHLSIVRGAERAERNQLNFITGKVDTLDASVLTTLARVRQPA
jgi:hypothetical protein